MTRSFRTRLLAGLGAVTLGGLLLADPAFATGSETDGEHEASESSWNTGPDDGDNHHPSAKDRSFEHGGSGTQGRSTSDPDSLSNAGADKPGGAGGVDKGDQDGNNGCGNDDDFEDDNNGNCGGRHKDRSRSCRTKTKSPSDDSVCGESATARPATTCATRGRSFLMDDKDDDEGDKGSTSCAKDHGKPARSVDFKDICVLKVKNGKHSLSGSGCGRRTRSACAVFGDSKAKPAGFKTVIHLPSIDSKHGEKVKVVLDEHEDLAARIEALKEIKASTAAPAATTTTVAPTTTTAAPSVSSASAGGGTTGGAAAGSATVPSQGEVMGISAEAAPAAGTAGADTLPFTGAGSTILLVGLAAACIVAGTALIRRSS